MDRVRYLLGVLNIVVLPAGLLYWFLIHPFARWWRKLGPLRTYMIVGPLVVAFGTLLYQMREQLLGRDLGTKWSLVAIALVLFVPMSWLEVQYWRHLSLATLSGLQELSTSRTQTGKLMQEGIYRVVRHPRYLSAGIGVIGGVLISNYVGVYILTLVVFLLGSVNIALEERELIDRFGDEYRKYQQEVPCVIPRWRKNLP